MMMMMMMMMMPAGDGSGGCADDGSVSNRVYFWGDQDGGVLSNIGHVYSCLIVSKKTTVSKIVSKTRPKCLIVSKKVSIRV